MPSTHRRRQLVALAATTLIIAVGPVTAYAIPSASLTPNTVAPGGRVGLNLAGCGTKTGKASSSAFGDVSLTPGNLEATNLFGTAAVYRDARAGAHQVIFECGGTGGQRVTLSLQVTPGAARGGTGGSIGRMSPGEIAIGGSLAAGALGAAVWLLRRRPASTP
ncbi:hypothetical protein DEJ50_23440 [Streptomyces venezuelae]|uniref:Uncharacterized protein n=1 Tax=Streptomyces venezuelae TaxID=54571 RepID=A0A5P2D6F5_STRVZ|nr:hypothetical protein [Streptomyces venezuelae]QES50333.1 hypothetical protein DEJ50_23440 [Streptomyces venezuelae]